MSSWLIILGSAFMAVGIMVFVLGIALIVRSTYDVIVDLRRKK